MIVWEFQDKMEEAVVKDWLGTRVEWEGEAST